MQDKTVGRVAIMVPGMSGVDIFPKSLCDELARTGWSCVHMRIKRFGLCDIESYVDQLSELIEGLGRESTDISLVGHSMGGLVARKAAQRGQGGVTCYVSIGTPHNGTLSANLAALATPARQMRNGSSFIKEMNEEGWPDGVMALSLSAESDIFVIPNSSTNIDFGHNVTIPRTNHLTVATSSRTKSVIKDFLGDKLSTGDLNE